VVIGAGGSLEYVNHLRKKQPLAELVPKQYLPITTALTESPLKNLDVFLQSKRVDFTQHEWSSCHSYSVATPTGTNLTEVKCEYAGDEQYGNANGVVAMIEFRKIPDDGSVSRGVSIGIKGSTRVLRCRARVEHGRASLSPLCCCSAAALLLLCCSADAAEPLDLVRA
jgi:hypothetical protein